MLNSIDIYTNKFADTVRLEVPLRRFLDQVEKPARYTGGELNAVYKNAGADIRLALAFPDIYDVGMAHLGMRILYTIANARPDCYAERVFMPWLDMSALMRKENIPLCTLESQTPLNDMDIVGFTLQYEMSYTTILQMLKLSNIPLRANQRDSGPFIIAGGPCACNCEPVAPFLDAVTLGDGEDVLDEILGAYAAWKKANAPREDFLAALAGIKGVYVPGFYRDYYDDAGRFLETKPIKEGVPERVSKRVCVDLDSAAYPGDWMLPFIAPVHDRAMLELFRGCTRGCRFCQAGFLYRPIRERGVDTLKTHARSMIESTGYEEMSLSSLSTGDYPKLRELVRELDTALAGRRVSLSLPSLRVDAFPGNDAQMAAQKKAGLTMALEAGTQRLRDVINKNVSDDDLYRSVTRAFEEGYSTVKLYFMLGLPTETMEDVLSIADIVREVTALYRKVNAGKRVKPLSVNVSAAGFVPKPFTPFQWEAQEDMKTLTDKQFRLKQALRMRNVRFNYHDPDTSFLEAVFARGDRRLAAVLEQAAEKGAVLDAWMECFDMQRWRSAFEDSGIKPETYVRRREEDEPLPWDHLDMGIRKGFLQRENERARREITTPDCRQNCLKCGISEQLGACPMCE